MANKYLVKAVLLAGPHKAQVAKRVVYRFKERGWHLDIATSYSLSYIMANAKMHALDDGGAHVPMNADEFIDAFPGRSNPKDKR